MQKMGDDSPGLRLRDFSKLIGQEHTIRSGVTNIEIERREEVPDQSEQVKAVINRRLV